MIIQHNIMAINSHRQLGINNTNLSKNLEKLSSGYRINRAADDAAGLAISEKMRAQITGLDRAILNAQDGASLIQTAEGALAEVHSMLNRMVELATQSANGTIQTDDRKKIEAELDALKEEIDRISQATNFNGIKLLDGSLAASPATELTLPDGLKVGENLDLTGLNDDVTITAMDGMDSMFQDLPAGGTVTATYDNAANTITVSFKDKGGEDVKYVAKTDTYDETATTDQKLNFVKDGDTATVASITLAQAADETGNGDDILDGVASLLGKVTAKAKTPDSEVAAASFADDKDGKVAAPTTFTAVDGGKQVISADTGTGMDLSSILEGYEGDGGDVTAAYAAGKVTISIDGEVAKEISVADYASGVTVATGPKAVDFGDLGEYTITGATGTADNATYKAAVDEIGGKIAAAIGTAALEVEPAAAAPVDPNAPAAAGNGLTMQVGDTADPYNKITVYVDDLSVKGLGLDAITMVDQPKAAAALDKIKAAIEKVSVNRGNLGALQNRLTYTINNLGVTTENMTAAESRIRDVDMAKEMMAFTKNNVLSQAAQAMLAQANMQPQQVLQLLR